MNPQDIKPEDCPEPGWHETHHYCPCCSWTNPDAPKSDAQQRDDLRAAAQQVIDYLDGLAPPAMWEMSAARKNLLKAIEGAS